MNSKNTKNKSAGVKKEAPETKKPESKKGVSGKVRDFPTNLKKNIVTKFKAPEKNKATIIGFIIAGVVVIFLLGMLSMSIAKNVSINRLKEQVESSDISAEKSNTEISQITEGLWTLVNEAPIEEAMLVKPEESESAIQKVLLEVTSEDSPVAINLKTSINDHTKKIIGISHEINKERIESLNRDMQAKLETLNNEYSAILKAKEELETTKAGLEESNQQIQSANKALQSEVQKKTEELAETKSTVKALEKEKTDLEGVRASLENERKTAVKNYEELKAEMQAQTNELTYIKTELEITKRDKTNLEKMRVDLEVEKKMLSAKILGLEQKGKDSEASVKTLKEEIDKLKKEIEKLKKDI
ncbi:MAG: hypothetical protein ABIN18_09885 [Pseudomonadota bacterium]